MIPHLQTSTYYVLLFLNLSCAETTQMKWNEISVYLIGVKYSFTYDVSMYQFDLYLGLFYCELGVMSMPRKKYICSKFFSDML